MNLDIRIPIGFFFSIVGVILGVYGLISDPALYQQHSLGINVNLWWGAVLFVFGLAMLGLAWSAAIKKSQ
jgi:hypothetical protein